MGLLLEDPLEPNRIETRQFSHFSSMAGKLRPAIACQISLSSENTHSPLQAMQLEGSARRCGLSRISRQGMTPREAGILFFIGAEGCELLLWGC